MKILHISALFLSLVAGFAFTINHSDFNVKNLNSQQLKISARISNAPHARISDFPCGAILTEYWIIATADCIVYAKAVRIDIGSVDINRPALSLYPRFSVIHPQYNADTFANNVALMQLDKNNRLQFPSGPNPIFSPIRLPQLRQVNETFEGHSAYFSGYGFTNAYGNNVSEFLLFSEQVIISNRACAGFYGDDSRLITPTVVCSTSVDARQGACFGDGGAPLAINEYGSWTLVGLLSFLHTYGKCGSQPVPNAFTRITSHFDFIAKTTNYQFRP